MQQLGGDCRRGFQVGPTLQVQVLDDGINGLWLRKHDGSVIQFLDLNTQEIANFSLVIDCEILGAVS